MSLKGKHILIGITGGIAAYKIPFLIRLLVKNEAEVKVIFTQKAHDFVTRLTISTLSKNPVVTDFYSNDGTWNNHVELALWADVFLIAPCTANTLAKMAGGIADQLLLATYLSAKCPVFVAPAMDLDMYAHPTTKANLEKIKTFGNLVIPAESGELASGLFGNGRMAEPEKMLELLENHFSEADLNSVLKGKRILVTAGPTYENIDPVRFIGNYSSGKMGFAIAESAARRGANVILISGPSSLKSTNSKIDLHHVISAQEMKDKVFEFFETVDIVVMSAAVADYKVKNPSSQKIKKDNQDLTLELTKNPDILKTMGAQKSHQFLVGFALETENEEVYAQKKLQDKNLDLIVLNSLQDQGAGFRKDTNKVTVFSKKGEKISFELKTKTDVAEDILDVIETHFK